jgi:lipid II:glycine glycyltransferase (peptidoglycan interpeptide bridge formation enzyme)
MNDFKKKLGEEYTEFVGEFDYILKPGMNFIYNKIIPLKHKIINKKLRKNGK